MSESSSSLGAPELVRAARRALAFQRYIFKKAWGIYYAVWALTFAVYFFLPSLLGMFGLSPNLGNDYALVAIDLAVSTLAGAISGRIVERARKASFIRGVVKSVSPFVTHKTWFACGMVVYFSLIIASAVFFRAQLLSIVFALATVGIFLFYYALKSSFVENLPFEGIVAIITFGFATTSSLLISFTTFGYLFYPSVWAATIFVWIGAAVYSRLRADNELADAEVSLP